MTSQGNEKTSDNQEINKKKLTKRLNAFYDSIISDMDAYTFKSNYRIPHEKEQVLCEIKKDVLKLKNLELMELFQKKFREELVQKSSKVYSRTIQKEINSFHDYLEMFRICEGMKLAFTQTRIIATQDDITFFDVKVGQKLSTETENDLNELKKKVFCTRDLELITAFVEKFASTDLLKTKTTPYSDEFKKEMEVLRNG